MPLAHSDVAEFLAAPKVVRPAARPDRMPGMAWTRASADRVLWRAPVDPDAAVRASSLVLTATVALSRDWSYTLRYRNVDVLRWDFTEPPCNHSNSRVLCPRTEFPPKVVQLEHEHRYVEGGDLRCVVPLDGMAGFTHEQALREFCHRTNIDFESPYRGPGAGEQLRIF
jgi:hypothetical protein